MSDRFDVGLFAEVMGEGYTEVLPIRKTMQGAIVPDLALDDPEFMRKKTAPSRYCADIQRKALAAEIIGDCLPTEPVSSTPDPQTELLKSLAKRTKPGLYLSRQVAKAAGSVSEGMKNVYEIFFDRFESDERPLVERAIKALDIQAFHTLLALA